MVNHSFFTARNITVGIVLAFALIWGALLPSRISIPAEQTFFDDAGTYHIAAVHLAQEGRYSLDGQTAFSEREPGYSFFLAGMYKVYGVGNRIAIFAAQALLHLLASLLFTWTLQRYCGRRAALITLGLLLFLPSVFHTLYMVYRESLTLSLLMLFTALLLHTMPKSGWKAGVGLGLLYGCIALTYYPLLFALPFVVMAMVVLRYRPVAIATLVLVAAVVVGMWCLRNARLDGHFRVGGSYRTAVMWYVRGEQSERVTGLEPLRCLWSEYISRNWSGRSDACSFNGLMHAKWPSGKALGNEDAIAAAGRTKIMAHLPNYLSFSVFEVLELHLPFVNGWGRTYNMLAALGSVLLYCGCLLGLRRIWKRAYAILFAVLVANLLIFVLTDATPRYLMPVIFCYASFAGIGYNAALDFLFPKLRS